MTHFRNSLLALLLTLPLATLAMNHQEGVRLV